MNTRRAFTVLEVMIAVAVFAMAAIVLGASYMNVLNSYAMIERTGEHDQDMAFARAMVLAEPDRQVVERGADFETPEGRRVSWRATVEPADMPDLFTVAFECEINSPQMKQPVRLTESFRVLRSTWSKPDERDVLRGKIRERIDKITPKDAVIRR